MSATRQFNLLLPDGTEQLLTEDVENAVFSLIQKIGTETWPDAMVIQGDTEDSGWLHLFVDGEFGWLVVCCGDGDNIEHFLVEGDSMKEVKVIKAGLTDEYKRKQFVRFQLAEKAIVEFLRSGKRLVSLCWEEVGM